MPDRAGRGVTLVAATSVVVSASVLYGSAAHGRPLPAETVNVAVIGAGAAAMAVVLRGRAPGNNLWRVLLAIAVNGAVAVTLYAEYLRQAQPAGWLVGALWLLDVALALPWVLVAGLFPDGHRPVRRWPELVAGATVLLLALSIGAWLTAPAGAGVPVPGHLSGAASGPYDGSLHSWFERAASLATGLLPLAALGCLGIRYRRSGPLVRQQIRVGLAGLSTAVVLEVALRVLPGAQGGAMQLLVTVVAVGVGQLTVAAALLRWRLWMVDRALPRAVVLGACSALFTAAIVVVALLLTGQVGRTQLRVALLSAVLVTVLLQGYSRRLEPWVRRHVYGDRPSGFGVLVGLADGLAGLDDGPAARRVVDAVQHGLAVPWVAMWALTARPEIYRQVAATGRADLPSTLPADAVAGLGAAAGLVPTGLEAGWPDGTAAAAPVGGVPAPWAILAVGQRRGDPLSADDLELLTAVARESDLARTNRSLSREVAASVDELEARARELRVSRQRLVAAQDEERRRIERDMHDGAQHELVDLAGRLRMLARHPVVAGTDLDELADQAERAVFSLQDLARGIYPSVLTDRGVVAAIRSFAGRMPVDVSLVVSSEMAARRFAPPVEVALYFVAVEALGNSRKHACATRTTVTLAEIDDHVVLEVSDDGVGFEPGRAAEGSGLQHMTDRMSALGGDLTVVGTPGQGTWLVARLPASAARPAEAVIAPPRTPVGRPAPPVLGG